MIRQLQSSKLLLAFLLFQILVNAQSGKISGRITDKVSGEGLPGVNIVILGTTQGAASDVDGYYSILNVRPGTYSVRASAIGFASTTMSGVHVSIDLTAKADFVLGETAVQTQEVVVVATKPMVTKDLTSSTSIVGAEEIASLPVTEFSQVLGLKAGMVGGKVRGGRSGEVVYAIDGVPMTDVYDGGTVVDVNSNSIQELQFVSGAFNAEYGRALSGYVNIATKDGDNKFAGSLNAYVGDYYSTHTDIFRNLDKPNPWNIHNVEGSLSGPIIQNKMWFYTDLRYIYYGGYYRGKREYNPWNITVNNGSDQLPENRYTLIALPSGKGDGKIVNLNDNTKMYGQGKLTYRIIPEIKLTYNYIYDHVDYRDFNQMYTLNPDGDLKKFRSGVTNILGMTHTLGSNTFYQLNFSYFSHKYKQYVYEDWDDSRYTNSDLLSQQPADMPSFYTGGTERNRMHRSTTTLGVKWDLTSQVTKSHQIKAGFEYNKHQLDYLSVTPMQPSGLATTSTSLNPFVKLSYPDINNPDENLNIDSYLHKPTEFSAYIQDKIELNEMIINLGVRFDYFSPDGKVLADPSDPDIYRPYNPVNIAKTIAERKTYWYKKASDKYQISPRLGVAFPVTDRGVVHFSYGHFFQIPNFDLLYQNPEYKFGAGTGNVGLAGNPDLKPQMTVSGEVGVQQALSDDISFDLTGYFRDIRDLAGTRADEIDMYGTSGAVRYSQLVNSDFGFVKGIVLTVTKRLSNNWTASIDYTLQLAKGNASDPTTSRDMVLAGQQPEIQLVRLAQDQTHTLNVTFSYSSPDLWGFSLIGSYGSGFPYTPTESQDISNLLINTETKPATYNVDFRAYKDFEIAAYKLSLFLRVNNLFDIKNQVNVYGDSGTADYTISENTYRGLNLPAYVNTISEYYRNPSYYSEPRRIEFGATLFF
jgi:outer membrane receptor for ferrienterochelin and colicin